jgi:hypothetical protein
MGCFFHGCPECKKENRSVKNNGWPSLDEKFEKTEKMNQYILENGYKLEIKWECEWKKEKSTMTKMPANKYLYPKEEKYRLTQSEILEAVKSGVLFGAVECDIHVPEHLQDKFSEMTPIFKNTLVTENDVGDHMQMYLKEKNQKFKPTRYLIGSMFGEKILLITPLLKWYLEQGLVVTKIYQLIQFAPKKCFKRFADQVSDDRRAGK